jgi:protein-S-isoprenylcysteine O-methyltransferase Ste14
MTIFDGAQIAFLVLSICLSLGSTWRLKKRNISVWVLARSTGSPSRKALEMFYLIGLVSWILLILLLATGNAEALSGFLVEPFFKSTALKILALPLLVLSFTLHVLGLHALGPNWRVGTSGDHPGSLVTQGIYATSRNPILLGMILYALSVWLTYSNLLLLIILFVVIGTVHLQIRREEAFLTQQHREKYTEYCNQVGRYLTLFRTP